MKRQLSVGIEIAQPLRGFDIQSQRDSINLRNMKNGLLCDWAIAVGLGLKGWNAVKHSRKEVCSRT